MARRTVVKVDRIKLSRVFEAIQSDPEMAKEFGARGAAAGGLLMRGDDQMVELRSEELAVCVEEEEGWHAGQDYKLRLLLHSAHLFLDQGKSLEEVAALLEQNLSFEVQTYRVAFEVLGLTLPGEPVQFGSAAVGLLGAITAASGLTIDREMQWGADRDPDKTMVVVVEVEAPESMKAMTPAARLAEDVLDLLASTNFRARFEHGPPWEMRLGRGCWIWPEDEKEAGMGMSNPWARGYNYEVERSTVQEVNERFQAPPTAWLSLPAGDMRMAMERAYVSLGAALRRAPDPHAAVARAWTAIETVFAWGRESGRAELAIANRFKIAAASGKGTSNPFELATFYRLRNDILHDALPWRWDHRTAKDKLGPLYRHLDRLAGFCIQEGISTREALKKRLADPKVVGDTRDWLEDWMKHTKFRVENAVLKEVRRRHGEHIEFFGQVLKACGPAPPKPAPGPIAASEPTLAGPQVLTRSDSA